MKSLFWLKIPFPLQKQTGKHISERSPERGGWETSEILSRLVQTMLLVGVVFMCFRTGGCEDMSIQDFITKAMKRYWVGNVGQFCLVLHHIATRLYH